MGNIECCLEYYIKVAKDNPYTRITEIEVNKKKDGKGPRTADDLELESLLQTEIDPTEKDRKESGESPRTEESLDEEMKEEMKEINKEESEIKSQKSFKR